MSKDNPAPHGYYAAEFEPTFCYRCDIVVGPEHWRKQNSNETKFGYQWRCGVQARDYDREFYKNSPEYRQKARDDAARRYEENKPRQRWLACRRFDKGRGFDMDQLIEAEDAIALMEMPCYYCASTDGQLGLDRLHSDIGHTLENCVPCCSICNSLLCDIPLAAKEIMKPALYQLRITGSLGDWIPPRFRNTIKSNRLKAEALALAKEDAAITIVV